MKITAIVSTLQVHNLDSAIEFYLKMGFNLEWKWPDSAPSHASISSSGFSFMLEKIEASKTPEKADLYFRIDNVDQIHAEFKNKHIEVSDLQKTAYGMLDFSVQSPNGHHLVFGQPSGEFEG